MIDLCTTAGMLAASHAPSRIQFGSLQDGTTALLSERIHLLAGEADKQAILLLVLGDKLHDLANGLGHRNALNCSFSAQLFCHRPLLLQVVGKDIHVSCI